MARGTVGRSGDVPCWWKLGDTLDKSSAATQKWPLNCASVGRPGLEPGTLGLKVHSDRCEGVLKRLASSRIYRPTRHSRF